VAAPSSPEDHKLQWDDCGFGKVSREGERFGIQCGECQLELELELFPRVRCSGRVEE